MPKKNIRKFAEEAIDKPVDPIFDKVDIIMLLMQANDQIDRFESSMSQILQEVEPTMVQALKNSLDTLRNTIINNLRKHVN